MNSSRRSLILGSAAAVTAVALAGRKAVADPAAGAPAEPSADVVALTSPRGCRYLQEASLGKFVQLSIHFVTQENLAYCGVASIVMVLNAAGVARPPMIPRGPARLWTQENVWTDAARGVVAAERVQREGMSLSTLGQLLASYGLTTDVRHAGDLSVAEFRAELSKAIEDPRAFPLVNYLRPTLGQQGGGHISPVAAYHAKADAFLVLDVARYRYEPVWVSTRALRAAAATDDAGVSRGFVVSRVPKAAAK